MVIAAHIKESLGLKQWGSSDLQANTKESQILRNWGITSIPTFFGFQGNTSQTGHSPESWEPPPANMYKLNFDGASKGNPGPAGFGGAIHNSKGMVEGLFWGYLGNNSNNVTELHGLLAGLTMASQHGWFPIIL